MNLKVLVGGNFLLCFFLLHGMAPQASAADLHNLIGDYQSSKTVSAISLGSGSYALLAEVVMASQKTPASEPRNADVKKSAGQPARSSLVLYKLHETAAGMEVDWKTTLMGMKSTLYTKQVLTDSPWGYLVSGQGTGSAHMSGAAALIDKKGGKILWRRWLNKREGSKAFVIGGVAANEKELLVVGTDYGQTSDQGIVFNLSPDKGEPTPFVVPYKATHFYSFAIGSDPQGESYLVGGAEGLGAYHSPFAMALDKDKKEKWTADFMGSLGYLSGVRRFGANFFTWGNIDDLSVIRNFDAKGRDVTQTIASFKISSAAPTSLTNFYAAGQAPGAYGQIVEAQYGKEVTRVRWAPNMVYTQQNELVEVLPRESGEGYVAFGHSLSSANRFQDHPCLMRLWILQHGNPQINGARE